MVEHPLNVQLENRTIGAQVGESPIGPRLALPSSVPFPIRPAVAFLVGLVWTGQGAGLIAGSAMTGSGFWAAAGVVLVIGGLLIGIREAARRPIARP